MDGMRFPWNTRPSEDAYRRADRHLDHRRCGIAIEHEAAWLVDGEAEGLALRRIAISDRDAVFGIVIVYAGHQAQPGNGTDRTVQLVVETQVQRRQNRGRAGWPAEDHKVLIVRIATSVPVRRIATHRLDVGMTAHMAESGDRGSAADAVQQQPDQGRVDVPDRVGTRGSNPNLRLGCGSQSVCF